MDNQRVRILISKGSRADRLLEMSSARQSEPQRADLNLHARTYQQSATPHVHLPRGRVRLHYISRQSALIAWHNAFKGTVSPHKRIFSNGSRMGIPIIQSSTWAMWFCSEWSASGGISPSHTRAATRITNTSLSARGLIVSMFEIISPRY